MKAEITKRCSVVCEVGSIVEVSESQYKALGDFAIPVNEIKPKKAEAEPETKTEKKTTKRTMKKKED